MSKIGYKIAAVIAFVLTMQSCQDEVVRPLTLGDEYGPVFNVGAYWEYAVDSSYVDDFFEPPLDTTAYFLLREVFADTFTDNAGRLTYKVERYKKMFNDTVSYDSMDWVMTDVWTATPQQGFYERYEENVRYVRLNYPVVEGKDWNGNAYNTFNEWNYEYENVHQSHTTGAFTFDSTLTVNQRDNINIIDNETAFEVYAKDVGLIEKHYTDQVKSISTGDITSGASMNWILLDYSL